MLNYASLNDVEFEYLCQDIMQKKLDTELHRFARGRDGGIDLADDIHKKTIIVQVKHYMNSSDKTFYFVVNSATVDLSTVKLSIEYKFGENDKYKAERTGLKKESDSVGKFESGKQYSYTLNIQDRALIISGSNIKNWEAGESLDEITINGTKQ